MAYHAQPVAFSPAALTAFTASLSSLPQDEVRKAKLLFVRNAIVDHRTACRTFKGMLIVMGVMSIIPVFLFVFIPALFMYRAMKANGKEKIQNALDIWRDDLKEDFRTLSRDVEAL